jgi:hypothetical protein
MQSPDGQIGDVPQERVSEAQKAGFQLCVKMRNPNSQAEQYVPFSLVDVHLRAGYTIIPE